MTEEQVRMAAKIAGLLAKAESTEHEAERNAYLEKAMALQEKYAVDATMAAEAGRGRNVIITSRLFCQERNTPLIKAKRELIGGLAHLHRGKAFIGPGRSYIKVVAYEDDLDFIDAMYTSMLLQLQTAMARDERGSFSVRLHLGHVPAGEVKGWRVSYAHAYVRRVLSRLTIAKMNRERETAEAEKSSGAPGSALVLASRVAAVDKWAPSRGKGRGYSDNANGNMHGASSGYEAGGRADLGVKRIGSSVRAALG